MGIKILGSYNLMNPKQSVVDGIGGKLILNLSNIMTKLPIETLINFSSNINRVIPETLKKYGEQYKNENVCYEIDVSKIGMAWRLPLKRIIFCNFFS
jgi:pyruvate,water dikinase